MPARPLHAGCRDSGSGTLVGKAHAASLSHDAPEFKCTCGIYAVKNLDHLRRSEYDRYGINGEVNLWGKVVEHERGWRAQLAYPKNLFLSLEMMPLGMGSVESRLKSLAAYGCDIFVLGKEGKVPLWFRRSGYDAAGLDVLVQRCKGWYAQRAQERRIKRGDRVAVLGRGIAVVEQVEGKWIRAVIWNKSPLRIARVCVLWDAQNVRWETSPLACVETNGKA